MGVGVEANARPGLAPAPVSPRRPAPSPSSPRASTYTLAGRVSTPHRRRFHDVCSLGSVCETATAAFLARNEPLCVVEVMSRAPTVMASGMPPPTATARWSLVRRWRVERHHRPLGPEQLQSFVRKVRRGQPAFRRSLVASYEGKC
jgi:hypothetical protein